MMKLSIMWYVCGNGEEGSVRENQEGCPSPLKSIVFEAFSEFQKLSQQDEKTFRHADDSKKTAAQRLLKGSIHENYGH
ncbi:MAG: hypothetical protein ACLUF9_04710 [Oscillospiraceae bacterium]